MRGRPACTLAGPLTAGSMQRTTVHHHRTPLLGKQPALRTRSTLPGAHFLSASCRQYADEDENAPPGGWRMWVVVALCCMVAFICYIDRAAISVAMIPMGLEYGWNDHTKGAVNR